MKSNDQNDIHWQFTGWFGGIPMLGYCISVPRFGRSPKIKMPKGSRAACGSWSMHTALQVAKDCPQKKMLEFPSAEKVWAQYWYFILGCDHLETNPSYPSPVRWTEKNQRAWAYPPCSPRRFVQLWRKPQCISVLSPQGFHQWMKGCLMLKNLQETMGF